ncbi:MAG TPA: hypothetical protein EYP59_02345, partial [Thiotrichaceae bacterium]|nr:hypothetical protein [Thiotrichaceae bacterium]
VDTSVRRDLVYNFSVANTHNYFVGEDGVLVHNGTKRVGRHMSPKELEEMKKTGKVQEGGGGQTRVADPANQNAYRNPPKGDVYVEFDVPADRVSPHSKGTGRIPGPKSPDARIPGRNPADYEMPPATNIKCF